MNKLDKMIGNDRSQAKITHALEEVCHDMPHLLRKECRHYVDKFSAKIIDYLVKKLPADQVTLLNSIFYT